MIWPSAGTGSAAFSPRQAMRRPLRLMFSVYIALRTQSAGDVTWHRSLISIRGLSLLLIFLICLNLTLPNLALKAGQHQYRKWAITFRCRRLSGLKSRSEEEGSGGRQMG